MSAHVMANFINRHQNTEITTEASVDVNSGKQVTTMILPLPPDNVVQARAKLCHEYMQKWVPANHPSIPIITPIGMYIYIYL